MVFSRFMKSNELHLHSSFTVIIRKFSRSYRPKGNHVIQKKAAQVKTKDIIKTDNVTLSWRPIIKQTIFTFPFLYMMYSINNLSEVIETKYQHLVKSLQFKFDVYDNVWGELLNKYFDCPDNLFNRRIVQIMTFSTACFVASVLLLRSEKMVRWFGSSAASSPFSPITSMFIHGSVPHLACNMLALYVLTIGWHGAGPVAHGSLDNMSHQHLLIFLILSGAITSIICNIRYVMLRSMNVSVGFSGALCSLMMFELMQKPESRVRFIFAPPDKNFSAKQASQVVIAFELLLLALSKFHRIDSFGHLVGLGCGYLYSKIGLKEWQQEKIKMAKVCEEEFDQ